MYQRTGHTAHWATSPVETSVPAFLSCYTAMVWMTVRIKQMRRIVVSSTFLSCLYSPLWFLHYSTGCMNTLFWLVHCKIIKIFDVHIFIHVVNPSKWYKTTSTPVFSGFIFAIMTGKLHIYIVLVILIYRMSSCMVCVTQWLLNSSQYLTSFCRNPSAQMCIVPLHVFFDPVLLFLCFLLISPYFSLSLVYLKSPFWFLHPLFLLAGSLSLLLCSCFSPLFFLGSFLVRCSWVH